MQTRENEVTIVAQQILDQVRRAVVGKDEVLQNCGNSRCGH